MAYPFGFQKGGPLRALACSADSTLLPVSRSDSARLEAPAVSSHRGRLNVPFMTLKSSITRSIERKTRTASRSKKEKESRFGQSIKRDVSLQFLLA